MTVQSGVACGAMAMGLAFASPPASAALSASALTANGPVIDVVRPQPGSTLTEQEPVVVLRIREGHPSDPIDFASFRVSVDGVDQTSRFHVTMQEAWGSIELRDESALASIPGGHLLSARICSVRGVCADTQSVIRVLRPTSAPAATRAPTRRERVVELLITAMRKLLR